MATALSSIGALLASASASASAPQLPHLERILSRAPGLVSFAGSSDSLQGPVAQSAGSCAPEWSDRFGGLAGVDGEVFAMIEFDDGTGPAVFVGGGFDYAGSHRSRGAARWDGQSWLPAAVDGDLSVVYAFEVFDDGSGPALYAGGARGFSLAAPFVARWNGAGWDDLPLPGVGRVFALETFDDGTGSALYVGGANFSLPSVGHGLVRWDGNTWRSVSVGPGGTATLSSVFDLEVFDDGNGPGLFVGTGSTNIINGTNSRSVPAWRASGWTATEGELPAFGLDLAVYDDGSGPRLYAGGFGDGVSTPRMAEMIGGAWFFADAGLASDVRAVATVDLGGSPRLIAACQQTTPSVPFATLFEFVGGAWQQLLEVPRCERVNALVTTDTSSGQELFTAGSFENAPAAVFGGVARWTPAGWRTAGTPSDLNHPVTVSAAFGSGADRRYVVERKRLDASGQIVRTIEGWNVSGWTVLGVIDGEGPTMLKTLVEGGREVLYVAGDFAAVDGVPIEMIARFDGTSWSNVGSGYSGEVRDVALFDDGGGERLFAAGFMTDNGSTYRFLLRLDGGA